MTRTVVLSRQPGQHLSPDDFEVADAASPSDLREGEVRLSVRWLSIDPYQRGLLDLNPVIGQRVLVGQTMVGRGVGQVIETRCTGFSVGDLVMGETGWRTEAVAEGSKLVRIDGPEELAPHQLGILGISGITALLGLDAMGGVGSDDTLLVSSAAGAVGSTVVQLAKQRGAKVVAITGGAPKRALLLERLNADAVIDRRQETNLSEALRAAAPFGISCFFDNVGEQTLVDGLSALTPRGRALLCGYIAGYEGSDARDTQETWRVVMRKRLEVRGFLVHDHVARFDEARALLRQHLQSGALQPIQTIVDGLENAPEALCGLLAGRSVGKVLVRIDSGCIPA